MRARAVSLSLSPSLSSRLSRSLSLALSPSVHRLLKHPFLHKGDAEAAFAGRTSSAALPDGMHACMCVDLSDRCFGV